MIFFRRFEPPLPIMFVRDKMRAREKVERKRGRKEEGENKAGNVRAGTGRAREGMTNRSGGTTNSFHT